MSIDQKSSEKIVYVNTYSGKDDYLAYTTTSISKGREAELPKKPKVLSSVKKVLQSQVPITDPYKKKALEKIRSLPKTVESLQVEKELNDRKTDDSYYKDKYEPDADVSALLGSILRTIEPIKKQEEEEVEEVLRTSTGEEGSREEEYKALAGAKKEIAKANNEKPSDLADEFLTETKKDGYTDKQKMEVFEQVKSLPATSEGFNKALDLLAAVDESQVPINLGAEQVTLPTPAANTEAVPVRSSEGGISVDTLSDNIVAPQEELVEAQTEAQTQAQIPVPKQLTISGSSGPKPFIKRYHPSSIQLYFGNSSYPDWDLELQASVKSLEINTSEVVDFMEDIIKEYGSKIFVKKRKSDTREELNELMQLQFTILRALKKPFRGQAGQTATVKLSDLIKIDKLANNSQTSSPGSASALVVNPITPLPTRTSAQQVPVVMSSSEDAFIRYYDKYLEQRNLNVTRNKTRTIEEVFPVGNDPRNTGILLGNNSAFNQTVQNKSRRF